MNKWITKANIELALAIVAPMALLALYWLRWVA